MADVSAAAPGSKFVPTLDISERYNLKTSETDQGGKPKEAGAPRLDSLFFNKTAAFSHFMDVAPGVHRSGRPRVAEGGIDEMLKKLCPNETSKDARSHVAIMDLRTLDDQGLKEKPKSDEDYVTNKTEVSQEEAACAAKPPIEYHRFNLDAGNFVSPAKMDEIVKTIDGAVAAGKQVDIHCFHGSDRTGEVAAAYRLTHDPQWSQLLKSNPEAAYQKAANYMIDTGCDPKTHTQVFRNVKQYTLWKSEELNGTPHKIDEQKQFDLEQQPLEASQVAALKTAEAAMTQQPYFKDSPADAYRAACLTLAKQFDPANHEALYKALHKRFKKDYSKE